MLQLFSNSHALPTLLLLHFVSSLNVLMYFFNDVRGSIVDNVCILRLCVVNFRQEKNLNALVALVACFPRVNWWNMQRWMQMTLAVIADCHRSIYGWYKVRTKKQGKKKNNDGIYERWNSCTIIINCSDRRMDKNEGNDRQNCNL